MDRTPAFLTLLFLLLLLSLTSACTEPSSAPALPGTPAFELRAEAQCPAAPDFVVTNEGELLAALAAASPGATIAVDGSITVTVDVSITTSEITLTCASAGSGLVAQAGAGVFAILNALASGVTVERLVLDGSNAETPFFAAAASGVRFTNNRATCGLGGECVFFGGDTPGAVVSDNRFDSPGSGTGLHLQAGIDGTRIERNTISTTVPSTVPIFGAIRARDGANVVIAGNTVRGPWANSLALADLASSSIEHNDLAGAALFGIRARSGVSFRPISMTDNVFGYNQISGAGGAGIFLTSACRNQLFGNNLQGNADTIGAVFDVPTGANLMVGNRNVVIDNGSFDCDGDGIADPNTIGGPGRVMHGVAFGRPPDDPGASASGKLR